MCLVEEKYIRGGEVDRDMSEHREKQQCSRSHQLRMNQLNN